MAVGSFAKEAALPQMATLADSFLFHPAYEFLLYRDAQTRKLTPGLAESWSASADRKSYTFNLRRGVSFHEGYGELTSEDVKFTIELLMQKDSVNPDANYFRDSVERIDASDPYKVVFHLKQPNWDLGYHFSPIVGYAGIRSKKHLAAVGEDQANKRPIGTGPYRLVDRRSGDFIKYEALDKHWRVVPEFKTLTFKNVPEEATRLAMLRAGEADIASLSSEFKRQAERAGVRIVFSPDAVMYYVQFLNMILPNKPTFDPKIPWVADPADPNGQARALKVRQALNLAVNRQEIIDKLFAGEGKPLHVPFYRPGTAATDPNWASSPYDPQKAKQLLAEAGYPNGFKLTMYLVERPGAPDCVPIGEAVAIYWEKIGLQVERRPMDFGTFRPQVTARKLGQSAWTYGGPMMDDPAEIIHLVFPSNASIMYLAEDPYIDEAMAKIKLELDDAKRAAIERDLGKFIVDNNLAVPIATKAATWGVSQKVGEWPLLSAWGWENYLEYAKVKR